ncbi:hypothetical protein GPECTOR_5g297 [Gonium pectorale]|uniref:C2 NT-type domain-containing protein n=1 Tax=Gonium pectorale TaxID=33097 RepID=A0A150GWQ9_GONPE|nr:hypothetical protein GPECTOR_5g297 [Gonium pectorale]|eukprot:KXZ54203.1 hypothetical protein GPECTOR_5g297 [Gonium pectorale]
MFGKLLKGRGGHGLKYKIDLQVTTLENLPTSIKKCRVVWARSAKVQITDVKDVRGSVVSFKQVLTQVTTIYKDKSGKFEPKEYEFKVQVPGKSSSDALVTIGKASMDIAKYCSDQNTSQNAMLPISFKVGGTTTGYLKMVITSVFLGDNEDGMTEVSGITGLTSDHGSVREQDLEGFGEEEHAKYSKRTKARRDDASASSPGTSSRSSKPESRSGRHKPLPPMAEEGSDMEDDPEASPPPKPVARRREQEDALGGEENLFARKVKPTVKKPPPKVWDDDEDVSPLNSDISDSDQPTPPPKSKNKERDESLDDMKSSLFATRKSAATGAAASSSSGPTAGKAAAAGAKGSKAAAVPKDEDGDSLRSDLFTAKPKAPKSLPPPTDEDDEGLRDDLFSAKPKAGKAAPPQADADKDLLRSDLFTAKAKSSKTAPASPDEDEDKLRNDLFSAKPKVTSSEAKPAHKKSAGGAPLPAAAGKGRPKSAEPEGSDDDDGYGPSTSSAAPPLPKSKSRTRSGEVPDTAVGKDGPSRGTTSKGGSSTLELEQLRQRIAQLEVELADEQAAKADLSKKMQKYVDKIADLEDQLAEGDVAELYNQMKDMENKYQADVKELMERHLAEIAEMEEQHRAELARVKEEAASSVERGASAKDLRRLEAELREQEAALKARTAGLEAEQAAANAARKAAEAKLAEANKMVDDSLLVATKSQQENKALQEEVARLKRQLEDASMWDTSAAVAAATAASKAQRSSEEGEEVEELREKVQELQV